jgi:hypothetical protein
MPPVARRLLIAVVILVVLLLAADRAGAYVAERTAASTIEYSQDLDHRPDVDIAGFPFLTQLAAGDFGKVTITARDVPVGEQHRLLDISRLHVVLHEVTVARSLKRVHADRAQATATVGYDDLGKTLGVHVSYTGGGRITASKSVTVAGRSVSGSVSARPKLADGALAFGAVQVNGAAAVGGALSQALNQVFDLDIPLQGIPFDVRVQSLTAGPDGIVAQLSGRDLSYSRT